MENGYRELTVRYLVAEEQYQKLCRITELYKERGIESTPERWLDALMSTGCWKDINDRLQYTERCLEAARAQDAVLTKIAESVA